MRPELLCKIDIRAQPLPIFDIELLAFRRLDDEGRERPVKRLGHICRSANHLHVARVGRYVDKHILPRFDAAGGSVRIG